MAEQAKKPDYKDADWTALIKDRHDKWNVMWDEFKKEGIEPTYLWDTEEEVSGYSSEYGQPIPRLAILPIQKEKRGIIVVCAGGGFRFKSSNEAKPVAEEFHRMGFNAAVLDYRFYPYSLDNSKEDGLRAIRYLRYHADELGIDRNHIAIGGFSAGGILSSMVINEFDYGKPDASDPIERVSSRPDAAFQMYGSFRTRFDPKSFSFSYPDAKSRAANDFILRLPLDAPPMFMAQTDDDDPHGVLEMALAYADRGIQHEYHMFHGGKHGGALFNGLDPDSPDFPHTAKWIVLASEWFELMGF